MPKLTPEELLSRKETMIGESAQRIAQEISGDAEAIHRRLSLALEGSKDMKGVKAAVQDLRREFQLPTVREIAHQILSAFPTAHFDSIVKDLLDSLDQRPGGRVEEVLEGARNSITHRLQNASQPLGGEFVPGGISSGRGVMKSAGGGRWIIRSGKSFS